MICITYNLHITVKFDVNGMVLKMDLEAKDSYPLCCYCRGQHFTVTSLGSIGDKLRHLTSLNLQSCDQLTDENVIQVFDNS